MGLDMFLYDKNNEEVMYWRKANAIHRWFYDNFDEYNDPDDIHGISYDDLLELKKICEEVLERRNSTYSDEHLPTQMGFFFGGTNYDDYYYEMAKQTIEAINKLNRQSEPFTYGCSW